MPELTRRRSPDAPDECWHVYFGDVHIGTIAIRIGGVGVVSTALACGGKVFFMAKAVQARLPIRGPPTNSNFLVRFLRDFNFCLRFGWRTNFLASRA